jgi:hypothetical protein
LLSSSFNSRIYCFEKTVYLAIKEENMSGITREEMRDRLGILTKFAI